MDHTELGFSKPLSWMQTYTGRRWIPTHPEADAIRIEDIAHANSLQCRYAGHCLRFFSVAEHQILMARKATKHKRECLMHDSTEAYLVDVPRGVKTMLTGYKEIEDQYARMIASKFGLLYPWPEEVHELDARILLDERAQNMPPYYMDFGPFAGGKKPNGRSIAAGYERCNEELDGWPFDLEPLGVKLEFWTPEQAEYEYLKLFAELS